MRDTRSEDSHQPPHEPIGARSTIPERALDVFTGAWSSGDCEVLRARNVCVHNMADVADTKKAVGAVVMMMAVAGLFGRFVTFAPAERAFMPVRRRLRS